MLEKGKINLDDANRFLSDSEPAQNTLYFKPGESRQSIDLPGGYSTDIEDEYNAMKRLYDEIPELVVEPVEVVEFPSEGYFMEYVEGRNLQSVIRDDIDEYNVEYVLKQISNLGRTIRETGVPHGDIRTSNFLITEESELRAIDPAGIPEDVESPGILSLTEEAVNWDITDVNEHIIDRVVKESDLSVDPNEYYVDHPEKVIQRT